MNQSDFMNPDFELQEIIDLDYEDLQRHQSHKLPQILADLSKLPQIPADLSKLLQILADLSLMFLQQNINTKRKTTYDLKWAATWQNQQSECAPSEDSDQPGHPPILIRVFAVRSMGR